VDADPLVLNRHNAVLRPVVILASWNDADPSEVSSRGRHPGGGA